MMVVIEWTNERKFEENREWLEKRTYIYIARQPSLFRSGSIGGELRPRPIAFAAARRPLGDHHRAERAAAGASRSPPASVAASLAERRDTNLRRLSLAACTAFTVCQE